MSRYLCAQWPFRLGRLQVSRPRFIRLIHDPLEIFTKYRFHNYAKKITNVHL